jgi:2-polyprenyl-6-methoxyphenol hydroxylase-like FAD-dependent oxidoreductase
MRSDICVIGGGPAGLAAALALTRSGHEVAVLDCAIPPIDKACGEGLAPDSLEALANLGVQLPDAGMALRGVRFLDSKSEVSADFPNGTGRGLRRVLLHQHLVAQAEALEIPMLWGVKNVNTRRGHVWFNGGHIRAKLIVGADGQKSSVREDAGLTQVVSEKRRYGFRRHYGVAPWSPYVEVHWGHRFQIYVTPVAPDQVCIALISRDAHLRLDAALNMMPALTARLKNAQAITPEKGSLTLSRKFRHVRADGYVLLGDASGSVDAITGEGMCLAFKQAAALAAALDAGDLQLYERSHRRIGATPMRMAGLLLMLDSNRTLQSKILTALGAHPQIFSALLATHVGHKPLSDVVSWQLLSFGLGVLCG